ncbi:hypothetical protein [Agarivorans sp. 1_MG-2023]|uniref:hypothetical protein n=1 Tax=Agarivorans sp. 1_MG-2023 TaxID=3062634 RepID=UPI0026E2D0F7|nr:hypothetical protein [Agarivorans sp. 1_MG-2023]MDO6762954.1 hypothetical protein [Agarivorans sp. 1_MG-2023]
MRINHICPYCMQEAFDNSGMQTLSFRLTPHMIHDSGVHEITCPRGHDYSVVLSAAKYEILFDVGMNALGDGYTRESVSSFASSLERFYEFFIKFQIDNNGISPTLAEQAWKIVSNQSERQLGAFTYLYICSLDKIPPELSTKDRGFRNKVIHKGYIPDVDEALGFGKIVYNHITTVISELEVKYGHRKLYKFYSNQLPRGAADWVVDESAKSMNLSRTSEGTSVIDFDTMLKGFNRK